MTSVRAAAPTRNDWAIGVRDILAATFREPERWLADIIDEHIAPLIARERADAARRERERIKTAMESLPLMVIGTVSPSHYLRRRAVLAAIEEPPEICEHGLSLLLCADCGRT